MYSLRDFSNNIIRYFTYIFQNEKFSKKQIPGVYLFSSGLNTDLFNYIFIDKIAIPMNEFVEKIYEWSMIDLENMCIYSRIHDEDMEKALKSKNITRLGWATCLGLNLINFNPPKFKSNTEIIKVTDFNSAKDLDRASFRSFNQIEGTALEFFNIAKNEYFNSKKIEFFLAYKEKKPAGLVLVFYETDSKACIYWLGVDPDYRNQGIAFDLILNALISAKNRNIKDMQVQAFTSSEYIFREIGFKGSERIYMYKNRNND